MSTYIDLHMHTIASSDGQFTPQELIHQCYQKGLKIIAIADHNLTTSIHECIRLGKTVGIEVVPAIELDCIHQGVNLHILGYGINPDDQKLIENGQKVQQMEKNNSNKLMEKVRDLGIQFETEQVLALSKDGIVVAETIAEVALADERNIHHPLLEPYRPGNPRSDNPPVNFYWDLCSQGKPAFVKQDFISLNVAINLIQQAGGFAVFAHPGNNIKCNRELALDIYQQGLCGFEVYSSYHDEQTTHFYHQLAKELNALVTVGSDYHGKYKPNIHLGMVEVDNETLLIENFMNKLKEMSY